MFEVFSTFWLISWSARTFQIKKMDLIKGVDCVVEVKRTPSLESQDRPISKPKKAFQKQRVAIV